MVDETKHGIDCTEFEALLSDAMDGDGLSAARKQSFEAHRHVWRGLRAANCGRAGGTRVAAVARSGLSLRRILVHNILVATSGVVSRRDAADTGRWAGPLRWASGRGSGGFVCCSGLGVRAAAAVCHVVRDDLLLVFAGVSVAE